MSLARLRTSLWRFASMAAAIVVVAGGLAGCSSSTGTGSSPQAQVTPSDITTGSTGGAAGAAVGEAAGGVRRGGVKIAVLLPLTSTAGTSEVARGLKQAGELALLEYDNPNIVLVPKDTRGTPEGAKTAAEEAVRAGAEIIIGPLFSREVAAAAPVARQAGVPVIALSSDQSVAGNGVYLLSFVAGQDVPRIVGHAISQGRRSFAALIPEGPYGKIVEAAFKESVQRSGGRVIATQTFPPVANGMLEPVKRIREAIASARQAGTPVDALFIPGGQDTMPVIAPLLPYNEIDTRQVKLIGTSDWDFANVGREEALAGGWYPAPDPKGWNEFAQRYAQNYGGMPPRLASLAYDAVSLVVALSGNAQGQRFTEANLTRSSGFAGIDGLFRLRPNGVPERGLAVLEVQRYGSTIVDPAPTAFPNSGVTASATSSGGGGGSFLPRFNIFGSSE